MARIIDVNGTLEIILSGKCFSHLIAKYMGFDAADCFNELLNELNYYRDKENGIMTNKKIGNDFEAKFCEILFNKGFWVHNMTQNSSGQPADVIAARNGITYLIDCKVCSTNRGFALSRIEENQDLSMDMWKACGNGEGWFAILVGDKIHMIPHVAIKSLREEKSYLTELDVKEYGIPLERWLNKSEYNRL